MCRLLKIEQMPDNNTPSWEVAVGIGANDVRVSDTNYYRALNSGTTGTIKPTLTDGNQKDGNAGISAGTG